MYLPDFFVPQKNSHFFYRTFTLFSLFFKQLNGFLFNFHIKRYGYSFFFYFIQ